MTFDHQLWMFHLIVIVSSCVCLMSRSSIVATKCSVCDVCFKAEQSLTVRELHVCV